MAPATTRNDHPSQVGTFLASVADVRHDEFLERLGPHTLGKGCVYVKKLDAVDRDVLVQLVRRAWEGSP